MSRLIFIIFFNFLISPVRLIAQQTETALVHGKRYSGYFNHLNFYVLNSKQDTILHIPSENFVGFKFKDFNKDGYKDIFLEWGGNMPGRYSLYVFVSSIGKFKELENFSDFPAAALIEGTKYYYSYYKTGCADKAWGSHIFYIKNYKAIKAGNIKGDGCGIKDGIYVYKISGDKKELIKTLPLRTIEKYNDYKWGFIKQFWTKNYGSFL